MINWLNDCSFVNLVAVVKYEYAGQEGYTNLFFKLLLTAVRLVPHKYFRILLEISVSGQWLKITNLSSTRDLPPPPKQSIDEVKIVNCYMYIVHATRRSYYSSAETHSYFI